MHIIFGKVLRIFNVLQRELGGTISRNLGGFLLLGFHVIFWQRRTVISFGTVISN